VEIRQLRYAVRLADELHFGNAAAQEFIAPSVFSTQIARLERELGVALFRRTSRRVEMTEAGARFVEGARETLSTLSLAVAESRSTGSRPRVLRVGLLGFGAAERTADVLCAFRQANPGVELRFQQLTFSNEREALLSGEVDVTFTHRIIDDERTSFVTLLNEPWVAAVPAVWRRELPDVLHMSDVLDEPWVALGAEGTQWRRRYLHEDARGGLTAQVTAEVDDSVEALAALTSGSGMLLTPAAAQRFYTFTGLDSRPVTDVGPALLGVSTRTSDPNPLVAAFRRAAEEVQLLWDRHTSGSADVRPVSVPG
jgi:DNA-binding transcriptional LysR family regulator